MRQYGVIDNKKLESDKVELSMDKVETDTDSVQTDTDTKKTTPSQWDFDRRNAGIPANQRSNSTPTMVLTLTKHHTTIKLAYCALGTLWTRVLDNGGQRWTQSDNKERQVFELHECHVAIN